MLNERVLNQFVVLNTRALLRSAVLSATVVLLLSFGGAIVGSPFLLTLLAWTARSTPSGRVALVAAVFAGLVGAEVGWGAAYVTIGERGPVDRGHPRPHGRARARRLPPVRAALTRPSGVSPTNAPRGQAPIPMPCDRCRLLPSVFRAGATMTSAFWNSLTVS